MSRNPHKNVKFWEDPQYFGTAEYHRVNVLLRNYIMTDGVKAMAKELECFWLVEDAGIRVMQLRRDVTDTRFFEVQCIRNDNGTAALYIYDGDYTCLKEDQIFSTDLKENVRFWIYYDEKNYIAYLPSEE